MTEEETRVTRSWCARFRKAFDDVKISGSTADIQYQMGKCHGAETLMTVLNVREK